MTAPSHAQHGPPRLARNSAGKARAKELVRLENSRREGKSVPMPATTTLWLWIDLAGPSMRVGTERLYRSAIRRHLAPQLGELDLRTLTHDHLVAIANRMVSNDCAASTARNALTALRLCCRATFGGWFLDRSDPFSGIGKKLRGMELRAGTGLEPRDSWSPEEAMTLLEVCLELDKGLYPALLMGLHTGARRGEILGLKWTDIDRPRRRIHIRRSFSRSNISAPKTGKVRTVVASSELLGALFLAKAGSQDDSGWVFPGRGALPLRERAFVDRWLLVKAEAAARGVRPLPFHCSRHTFASLALSAGKSVRWVADMLGHSDPMVTLRVYAHALPEDSHDLSFLPCIPEEVETE